MEGSTRLVQALSDRYGPVLEAHNRLLRDAICRAGGVEVRTEGDSFFAVFTSAVGAVEAAVEAQRALTAHTFPEGAEVRVRMGLHTGVGALGGDDYLGIDVHRAARVGAAGHGGQVLLSSATVGLVEHSLPSGVELCDLGVHSLKDLSHPEHLHQIVIEGLPSSFPPLHTLDAVRHNLPTHLTSFVGRQTELADALELLEGSRLLTMTGPGGTGKTRLALQTAAAVADCYPDGVYFVELDSVADEDLVPAKILETLPFHASDATASPVDQLVAHLAERSMLIVLDNFEHVVGAAPIAARILQASPRTKILVTSRVPLRLGGEQEMQVPPLAAADLDDLPHGDALLAIEAVSLFVERARAVRPSFSLDDESARAVAELTARLDGLPLAIELAASRVRVLSPQALLQDLGPTVLSGGARDLPVRHQALHDTIAWSYDLLPDPCRLLFERLSVFAGTATFAQIEAVCREGLGADAFDALEALVEHSLVRQVVGRAEPRFGMLETIRRFARDRLAARGEESLLRERHARVYAEITAAAAPHLTGVDRVDWLDRLSDDHDDIRLAQAWAIERGETDMAFEMASALWRFFHMRGHLYAAQELLDELLALSGGSPSSRAKVLEAAGGVAYWSGDMSRARTRYQEALDIVRAHGNPAEVAQALYNLAFARGYDGDFVVARNLLGQALDLFHEVGDKAGIAAATWGLGDAWSATGDLDKARDCFARSIIDFEQLDDPFGLGWALFTQGYVMIQLDELDSARDHLVRGLRLFESDVSALVMYLAAFATLAWANGDRARGARLVGAMAGLRDETGTDLVSVGMEPPPGFDLDPESLEPELAEVYEQGRSLTAAQAVELALETAEHPGSP